jgi:CRP-like cAMP-binding protein
MQGALPLLKVRKKDYQNDLLRMISEMKYNMINFLMTLPAFSKLSKVILTKITHNLSEKLYSRGQVVFHEGDEANQIYIIKEGECKLRKALPVESSSPIKSGLRYKNFTARRVGRGTLVGEEYVNNRSSYSYTCVCSSDMLILYAISAKEFLIRINADNSLDNIKKQSLQRSKQLDNWKDLRSSLANLFDRENTQRKINSSYKMLTERQLSTSSLYKRLDRTKNQSTIRLRSKIDSKSTEKILKKTIIMNNINKKLPKLPKDFETKTSPIKCFPVMQNVKN